MNMGVGKCSRKRHDGYCFLSDLPTYEKAGRRTAEEGIFKRSSAFLANLTQSACRITERRSTDGSPKLRKGSDAHRSDVSSKYPGLRGYFSILSSIDSENGPLRRSPSVHTLPVERKKRSGSRVKKSVSFSSDTSFEEKRAPYRKVAIHEAKVYCKGVLQGTRSFLVSPGTRVYAIAVRGRATAKWIAPCALVIASPVPLPREYRF